MLPDDILLAIFDFWEEEYLQTKTQIEAWQPLVHVCQRWRNVVFGSPHRLNLRLACTAKTPVRDTLDVWSPLPLVIRDSASLAEDVDSIVAGLKRSDRVHTIELFDIKNSPLEKVLAAMQEPLPELALLLLRSESEDETMPVVRDSFLGGSAPSLRYLWLERIPFPSLPKLLLSGTRFVDLHLRGIPQSGYISPGEMAACLSTLSSLERLSLGFRSPRSFPEARCPPFPTRSVLPVLAYIWFKGVTDYLDDLVARIDAPRLNNIYITFFNQIVFDTPQLIRFVGCTPTLKTLEKARIAFEVGAARVNLTSSDGELIVRVSCRELDWQLSSLEQICTSSLPHLSKLEDLYIFDTPHRQNNIENTLWLELLHPFTAVKNLYLSEKIVPHIVPALREPIGGGATEVLPTLQNIFLEGLQPSGPVQEGIGQFVSTRQATNHLIAVSRWDKGT